MNNHNDYFEKEYGPIRCGSYCPVGWFDLVERTLKQAKELDPDLVVNQIKSKFGGLRLYVESDNKEVLESVRQAEAESYNVCVLCSRIEKSIQGPCSACIKKESKKRSLTPKEVMEILRPKERKKTKMKDLLENLQSQAKTLRATIMAKSRGLFDDSADLMERSADLIEDQNEIIRNLREEIRKRAEVGNGYKKEIKRQYDRIQELETENERYSDMLWKMAPDTMHTMLELDNEEEE